MGWLMDNLDTREKPFACQCGSAFTRRDLLTRHWRISGHNELAASSRIEQTQGLQQQGTTSVNAIDPNGLVFENVGTNDVMLAAQNQHHLPELVQPAAPFNEATAPGQHQAPYQDEGFEDFRDFVNFIDGVGLSAQWTPEYDIDWMRIDAYQDELRRHSQDSGRQNSPGADDIGTPFSTWLPSAPANDQVHLRSQSGDGESSLSLRLQLWPLFTKTSERCPTSC
jgi:hypothetical protein